ncbi:MAG: hypothetical protein ABI222_01655 [Opitutaceae bacterium]
MSKLQQSLDARRADIPFAWPCLRVGAQVPALLVCIWESRSWVLPWSCLLAARFEEDGGGEALELSFTGHVVKASGHNLRGTLEDIAGFRVACLRNLPLEYRVQFPGGTPFLVRLEVRSSAPGPSPVRETPG